MTTDVRRPFGRLLTAMVTPFDVTGSLDLDKAQQLANYLVEEQGNDAIVVNGTTGESPTTTDTEKAELVRAVKDAVAGRALVIAGAGNNDTIHTVQLVDQAAKAGADGVLIVTPYYNKPPQAGVYAHFKTIADSTELPILVYDIPGRAGIPIETSTMIKLAEHERIVAVKDAKGLPVESAKVMAETDLAYYAGDDAMTLPLLAVGAVGVVGTSTHFSGRGTKALIEAFERGDHAEALRLHRQLLPIYTGIFRTQGTILVKAGLRDRGLDVGPVRLPLIDADDHELSHLRQDLAAAGL